MSLNKAEVNDNTQEQNNTIPTPEQFMQKYTLAELAEMEHNIHEAIKQITEQEAEKNKQHMQEIKEEKKNNQEEQQTKLRSLTQQLNDETPPKEKAESLSQDEIEHIVAMIRLVDENFEEKMHNECNSLGSYLEEKSNEVATGKITKQAFGQEVINGLKSIFIKRQENNPTQHVGDYEKLQELQKGVNQFLDDFDIRTEENERFLINLQKLAGYTEEYCYM